MKRRPGSLVDPESAAAAWSRQRAATASEGRTLSVRLVTPMFGGGVLAGEVDREMPVRVSAIRGQLRFWWRVACTAPSQGDDSSQQFSREIAIWGGISQTGPTASLAAMRITTWEALSCEAAHRYQENPKRPGTPKALPVVAPWAAGYALFSAQGKRSSDGRRVEEAPKVLALPGLGFQLSVRLDEQLTAQQRQEVDLALRWWASFGGVGARTRRGLGAVLVEGLPPVNSDEVQAVGGRLALGRPAATVNDAWKHAISLLRDFRQAAGVARNPGSEPNRPGRSLWPEADSLRALSGRSDPRHANPVVDVNGFPRAAFGLPLVFHFKDKLDPDDHVLEPADAAPDRKRERMASPLILRPYRDGEGWRPAALLLPGWQKAISAPLKLKGKPYVPACWPADAGERERLAIDVPPMCGRGAEALSAFMDVFEKEGR
jgi:CRISPR-associated protein Cmr1